MHRAFTVGCLFATLSIAPAGALAQDETPAEIAAKAGCTTVDACLAVATARHVHAERRYWAKRFLDAHPTPDVAAAFAALADADLWKLRDVAWWYFDSHPGLAAPHAAQLLEALRHDPEQVYRLPVLDRAGWEPLQALTLSLASPDALPRHLKRLDSDRARALGFALIRGEVTDVRAPDAVIAGLFENQHDSLRWPEIRSRLEAIITGDESIESRRRAVVALTAAMQFTSDLPDGVRSAYTTAPEPVRRQMRDGFRGQVGTPEEHAGDLRSRLREDPREALAWAHLAAGPAASACAPQIASFLHHRDWELRWLSQNALFVVDRATWRRELPRLASSPDIEVVLEARSQAEEDGPESYAAALAAGRGHWYPRLEQAWAARRAQRAREQAEFDAREATYAAREAAAARGETIVEEAEEIPAPIEGLFVPSFVIYGQACPTDAVDDGDAGTRASDSLLSSPETLTAARTYADVDTWHFDAALRFGGGWLSGGSRRQHEGALWFTPDDAPAYQLATSIGSEPLLVYAHAGSAFAVIGGQWAGGGNFSAGLLRIDAVDGVMQRTDLLQLPAPPLDAVIRDGRLLMTLEANGWVDLTDPSAPRWLGCGAEPPRIR